MDNNSTTCTLSYLARLLELDYQDHSDIELRNDMEGLSPYFSHKFYELFLLFFRTQPNLYNGQVTPTPSLQCYPRYKSQNNISLAYSSSISETASTQTGVNTLSHFRGLFNDHRRPIRSNTGEPICRTYFFNISKNIFFFLWMIKDFHLYARCSIFQVLCSKC